jgi:hypothetical protein
MGFHFFVSPSGLFIPLVPAKAGTRQSGFPLMRE